MNPKLPPKVTLDDLLRVKRAERPSSEFWTQFEAELRAKQLAALVRRRPWWSDLGARTFGILARYGLPVGAAAAVAMAGWVYQAGLPAAVTAAAVKAPKQNPTVVALVAPKPAVVQPVAPAKPVASAMVAAAVVKPVAAPKPAEQFASTTPAHGSDAIPPTPWTTSISADDAEPVRLTGNGALNLGDLAAAALDAVPVAAAAPAVAAAEESPRARLLGLPSRPEQLQVVAAEVQSQVLEQTSHRLNEELLHTATRHIIGMDGSTVTVRF
jgi:hypothetical protein